MPHICGVFDSQTQAVITAAATRFADNSPFTFDKERPFHVPLIGGLHVYTKDEISAAVSAGSAITDETIRGRFVRWEASAKGRLRVVVELSAHDGLVHLSSQLPRGKEWRDDLYAELGSLEAIDRAAWDSFIEAVAASFPITDDSVFTISHLDFVDTPKRPAGERKKKLNPHAPVFKPSGRVSGVSKKTTKPRPHPTGSTDKKWVRPGLSLSKALKGAEVHLAGMDLDTTAITGARRVSISKKPLDRALKGPLARH